MSVFYYKLIVKLIAILHLSIIALNFISIPLIIINEPFWLAMPLITLLVSPLIGGSYCLFNVLENKYRVKAGLPEINDRTEAFVSDARKAAQEFCKEIKRIFKGE